MSYSSYWDNRIDIVIDSSKVSSDLTDFPFPIKISDESGTGNQDLATSFFEEISGELGREYFEDFTEGDALDTSDNWTLKVPSTFKASATAKYEGILGGFLDGAGNADWARWKPKIVSGSPVCSTQAMFDFYIKHTVDNCESQIILEDAADANMGSVHFDRGAERDKIEIKGNPGNTYTNLQSPLGGDIAFTQGKWYRVQIGWRISTRIDTQTTISFSVEAGDDHINDSNNGLASVANVDDKITVSGSANNDGTYTVTAVAAGTIDVSEALVNEAAGAEVTITRQEYFARATDGDGDDFGAYTYFALEGGTWDTGIESLRFDTTAEFGAGEDLYIDRLRVFEIDIDPPHAEVDYRKRIAVTQSDEETELPCEFVSLDNETQKAVIVVKTDISSSVDTRLVLWFDNTQTDNTNIGLLEDDDAIIHNVWDDYHVAIWHLEEDPSGTDADLFKDSTSYDNHGTAYDTEEFTVEDSVAGDHLGREIVFDNATMDELQYIEVEQDDAIDAITDQISVFASVKKENLTYQEFIVAKYADATDKCCWALEAHGQKLRLHLGNETTGVLQGTLESTANVLYSINRTFRVGFTFNAGTAKLYVDGEEIASSWIVGYAPTSLYTSISVPVTIAEEKGAIDTDDDRYGDGSADELTWFSGRIDEVYISNVARSAAWISAEYYSFVDNLANTYIPSNDVAAIFPKEDDEIFTSSVLTFYSATATAGAYIYDPDGHFTNITAGDQVSFSGTASNDGTHNISKATYTGPVGAQSSNIYIMENTITTEIEPANITVTIKRNPANASAPYTRGFTYPAGDSTFANVIAEGHRGGAGSITLPYEIVGYGAATGTILLPLLKGGAGYDIWYYDDTNVTFPLLTLEAEGNLRASSIVMFPDNYVVAAYTGATGVNTFPYFTIGITAGHGIIGNVAMQLEKLEILGYTGATTVDPFPGIVEAQQIGPFTVAGSILQGIIANSGIDLLLKRFTVNATAETEIIGILQQEFKKLKISGTFSTGVISQLEAALKILSIDGELHGGILGTLAASLPSMTITATGFPANYGDVAITLPSLEVDPWLKAWRQNRYLNEILRYSRYVT